MAFNPATAKPVGGFNPATARPVADLKVQNPAEYDPASPEWQAKYGPVSDSGPRTFLEGIGQNMMSTARGVGQLAGRVSRQDVDAARAVDQPLLDTTAGQLGSFTGAMALTAPLMAIPGAASVRGAAATGGAIGAAQPVGENESRGFNAGAGAVAGGVTAGAIKGAGRLFKPIQSAPSAADARAIKVLEDAGVKLDAAQKSGSSTAQAVKSALNDNLLTRGKQAAVAEGQKSQYTRAVLKTFGADADVADEAVMGAAKSRIGQVFNDVLGKHSVRFSKAAENRAAALESRAARVLNNDTRIQANIASIREHVANNGGALDGRFYQTVRGDLSALSSEPNIGPIARELMESLDDAFQQVAGKDAQRLTQARREWRNMKIVENAIDKEGGGVISPARLANQFGQKRNRNVGIYGNGDKSIVELSRLAKAGKRLLPDKMPNSGTVPRGLAQAALPAAAGAAYGGVTEGDWSGAASYAIGGALAPYAIQRLINSPGGVKYLTQGAVRQELLPEFLRRGLVGLERAAPIAAPNYLLAETSK